MMMLIVLLGLSRGAVALQMPALAAGGKAQNKIWKWRGYDVRYWEINDEATSDGPAVLLVHGLFLNADHWRKNAPAIAAAGCRVYALDLLGSGYSSKPNPRDQAARDVSGERRFAEARSVETLVSDLGSADGRSRSGAVAVEQRHPVEGSPYNFFTWSEQLADFATEIVGCDASRPAALVCNSIGCISGLQAAVDRAELFQGALLVAPNFRELHWAEQPAIARPFTELTQRALRRWGQPLFDALATPATVRAILESQPYHVKAAVTDELVEALLSPLLGAGAADVVFDTLSYSAGPLPEQLLQSPELIGKTVWACYGDRDPWTPPRRVEALTRFAPVERVVVLPEAGHCPHDEAPERVNPLILDFLRATFPTAQIA